MKRTRKARLLPPSSSLRRAGAVEVEEAMKLYTDRSVQKQAGYLVSRWNFCLSLSFAAVSTRLRAALRLRYSLRSTSSYFRLLINDSHAALS